jgi:hypothetical protein
VAEQCDDAHGRMFSWDVACWVIRERMMPVGLPRAVKTAKTDPDVEAVRDSWQEIRVAVRAEKNGRYSYQIFIVAGEPKTVLTANRSTYDSPAEAAGAGLRVAATLNCISRDLI